MPRFESLSFTVIVVLDAGYVTLPVKNLGVCIMYVLMSSSLEIFIHFYNIN